MQRRFFRIFSLVFLGVSTLVVFLLIGIFPSTHVPTAYATCPAPQPAAKTVPWCNANYSGAADRVDLQMPTAGKLYTMIWWWTDTTSSHLYHECYAPSYTTLTPTLSGAMNPTSMGGAGKGFPTTSSKSTRCWPNHLSDTTGGIGIDWYYGSAVLACPNTLVYVKQDVCTKAVTLSSTPTAQSSTSVTVKWTPPSTWVSTASYKYNVTYTPQGGSATTKQTTGTTFVVPATSSPCKSVSVKVGVYNSAVYSSAVTFWAKGCPTGSTPTATPTPGGGGGGGATPTATPPPAGTPTVTPPQAHTILNLALQLPGIGIRGNLAPQHTTRTLHLSIYAKDVDPSQPNIAPLYDNKTLSVTFDPTSGYFLNKTIDIGNTLPSDSYQILVKSTGFLRKEVIDANQQKTILITAGVTNQIPTTALITGDTAQLYNVLDIADFYGIVGCYGAKSTTSSCSVGAQIADLNDDGTVDGVDLNYWLIGFATLLQNGNTAGTGDGVTGD